MQKTVMGQNVAYDEKGTGDIIFLIHGWGANRGLYNPVIETLSKKFHTVSFDLPGFGGSDEPPEAWSVDQFADLVSAFIESFGEKKVILLGHSYGGRVIIKLATRKDNPFEIDRVVLVDAAGIMPKRTLGYKIRVKKYKIAKKFFSLAPMKKLFPNAIEKRQKKSGSSDYAAASPVMRGCLVKAVNEDLTPLLHEIPCEALLIWGTDDDATPLSDGETMEKLIPNAGLAKIEGAGHFSWLDSPYVFDSIIKSYFSIG